MLGWLREGVNLERQWKSGPPAPFNQGVSLLDVDEEQQAWLDAEVTAIRNELASTQIHQEVLDKRRRMLQARLASLGAGQVDEAAY